MVLSTQNAAPPDPPAFTFSEAAKLFPSRYGRPVSTSTLFRWHANGVIGPDGRRVRLETLLIGGRRVVTQDAIDEFLRGLNAARQPRGRDEHGQRAHEAGKALEALGS